MIDIIMTTYNRLHFLKQALDSLLNNARSVQIQCDLPNRVSCRIHVIDDCSTDGTREYLSGMKGLVDDIVLMDQRRGLVHNFNLLWDKIIDDPEYPYLCYLQDDVVATTEDWLSILSEADRHFKSAYNAGFTSAYDAPEHPALVETELLLTGSPLAKVKRSTSMQNLFGEKSFWKSIGKPPLLAPDGSRRGFPNDGKGSNIDVWFTGCYSLSRFDQKNSSPNSLYKQNKRVLVIPMLKHLGIEKKDSTWRQNRVGDL